MKKLKYILFATIISFASICFTSNVFAEEITCSYTIDYPFLDNVARDSFDEYIKFTYSSYLRYFNMTEYRRVSLNATSNENTPFENAYFDRISNKFLYGLYDRIIESVDLKFKMIKQDKDEIIFDSPKYTFNYIDGTTKDYEAAQYSAENVYLTNISKCPNIIIAIPEWSTNSLKYSVMGKFYPINIQNSTFPVDNALAEFFGSMTWRNLGLDMFDTMIFMDNEAKMISGGTMYIAKAYNTYFNDVQDDFNVNPIVKYYLGLDPEFKTILGNIIAAHDSGSKDSLSNMEISKLSKITDFSRIENDLSVLRNFNSTYNVGLRGHLKKFLNAYGNPVTVTEFFTTYAPDNAQYVDALIELLEFAKNNQSLITAQNDVEEVVTDIKDCEENDTECIKKACIEVEKAKADLTCNNQNDSHAVEACRQYQSSASGLKNIEGECKDKTKEEVIQEAEKVKEELEEYVQEKFAGYYTEIFKNLGYDIEISDFCDILTSGSIYDYIKLVLNLIRIGGPILVIGLTAFDGMKMISSFKEDENKKFWNHLKIRLICLVILILVPTIINFVVDLFIEGSCNINV